MDADGRLAALRRMCGYVENGSDATVRIFQDDATRTWFVSIGKRSWYGDSFNAAIDAAAADYPEGEF